VDEFNRRLDITEIYMFTRRTVEAGELNRLQQALHGDVEYVCEELERLSVQLHQAEQDRLRS
jgi:hypothetical protein